MAQKTPIVIHPDQLPLEFLSRPAAYINQLFETGGAGTIVQLAQASVWELEQVIKIFTNNVELSTYGYPTDPALYAQIHPVNHSEPTAIAFYDTHHVKLSNLTIDGQRESKGWIQGGNALVVCGGRNARDPVVQYCVLRHPRGWSCLHVFDHCQGGRVVGNKIGPAGLPAPDGPWADGLSIACRDGLIANNEIVDATDGAIVLFCTPGTICIGNTIIARERNLLGAINMVDAGPYKMDYTNTRVIGNVIRSEGAHIKLGIGIGPLAWAPGEKLLNFGGQVHDNYFGPGRFGYAIGISGAKDFSVKGNRVLPGAQFTGDMSCMPEPLNAPPMPFLYSSDPELIENCDLQPEFLCGRANWLIGIEDGPLRKLRYDAGQLELSTGREMEANIVLDNTTLQLQPNGLLSMICNSTAQLLWTSGVGGAIGGAKFELTTQGHLTIREKETNRLIWDPTAYLEGKLLLESSASLSISERKPFLVLWTADNCVAWASEYVFEKGGLELSAGQFICIAPGSAPTPTSTAPPPIPPRHIMSSLAGHLLHKQPQHHGPPPIPPRHSKPKPMFLYLDPFTSNLVLHQGPTPTQPHGHVLWASELFPKFERQVKSREGKGCETKCCFQGGDGNLVIYGNPFDHQPEERTALWASGTVCNWMKIDQHHQQHQQQPLPAVSFHDDGMEVIKKFP